MEDFVNLSGDLMFERRKLSESLKRLESMIGSPEVSARVGGSVLLDLQAEIDRISSGILKLETLAKNMSVRASGDRVIDVAPFLDDMSKHIVSLGVKLGRKLSVRVAGGPVKVDQDKLAQMRPVFMQMLEAFIEFSIESPKERVLREKKEASIIQLSVKREGDGVVLSIVADGNGIIPPLSEKHGRELARIGLRASFDGRPGRWSCWILHVPNVSGVMNCMRMLVNGHCVYLPAWSVVNIRPLSEVPESEPCLTFDHQLNRITVGDRSKMGGSRPVLEVSSGIRRVFLLTDCRSMSEYKKEEAFVKTLPDRFDGDGRYLGIAVEVRRSDQMLNIIMNPTYVVYGKDADDQSRKAV